MSELTYPWQQSVLDAFTASREALPAKINLAEKAIAARLMEHEQPDQNEKLALRDALNALRVLIAEIRSGADRKILNKDTA